MGCCFSFNKPKINITDETPDGTNFNYLMSKGTVTYIIDRTYNIPLIELFQNFDGWFESSVCLWPKNNKARSNFLLLERTPPVSTSISFSSESGIFDTVF